MCLLYASRAKAAACTFMFHIYIRQCAPIYCCSSTTAAVDLLGRSKRYVCAYWRVQIAASADGKNARRSFRIFLVPTRILSLSSCLPSGFFNHLLIMLIHPASWTMYMLLLEEVWSYKQTATLSSGLDSYVVLFFFVFLSFFLFCFLVLRSCLLVGDKLLEVSEVCPQNGTAARKGPTLFVFFFSLCFPLFFSSVHERTPTTWTYK